MYKYHSLLFDYSNILIDTEINEISIKDKKVHFKLRHEPIELEVEVVDKRTAPFEIINFNSYEKEYFNIMSSLIDPGNIVFDI